MLASSVLSAKFAAPTTILPLSPLVAALSPPDEPPQAAAVPTTASAATSVRVRRIEVRTGTSRLPCPVAVGDACPAGTDDPRVRSLHPTARTQRAQVRCRSVIRRLHRS